MTGTFLPLNENENVCHKRCVKRSKGEKIGNGCAGVRGGENGGRVTSAHKQQQTKVELIQRFKNNETWMSRESHWPRYRAILLLFHMVHEFTKLHNSICLCNEEYENNEVAL